MGVSEYLLVIASGNRNRNENRNVNRNDSHLYSHLHIRDDGSTGIYCMDVHGMNVLGEIVRMYYW